MTESTDAPPKRDRVHYTVELLNAIPVAFDGEFERGDDNYESEQDLLHERIAKRCMHLHQTGVMDGNTWYPAHQIQHVTWTTEEITDAQTN